MESKIFYSKIRKKGKQTLITIPKIIAEDLREGKYKITIEEIKK